MERALIAVGGDAERLQMSGVGAIAPLFSRFKGSVMINGGFMTTVWVHARPENLPPARATLDLDLGFNRKALRVAGDQAIVAPALEGLGFERRPQDEPHRYSKELAPGQTFLVDLVIAKGASREEPPQLERGVPTLAAPGLAYALRRGIVEVSVEFSEGATVVKHALPLPQLDAALVLKGALAGTRTRPDKLRSDTVDAIMLAALCLDDPLAISSLSRNATNGEVKRALRFLRSGSDPGSREARRVEEHFAEEQGIAGMGAWAAQIAGSLFAAAAK